MSMASSWPSGDDLMDGPPPRCPPAPAPAQTWGSGTSGPIFRHFSAGNGNGTTIAQFHVPGRTFPGSVYVLKGFQIRAYFALACFLKKLWPI